MAVIIIGAAAINRSFSVGIQNTLIVEENPANASGKITSIEIWANSSLVGCEVATFYKTNANTFRTRATVAIGSVRSGSKQTFPVDLEVEAGDYIGIHSTSGKYELDTSGEGWWYKGGDQIPCTDVEFSHRAQRIISLYGTGISITAHEWEGSDSIAIGEALVKTPMKMLSDGIQFSDVLVKNPIKVFSDAFAFTDVWTGYKLRVFEFIDGIKIGEALQKTTSKVVSDGIKISEALERWWTQHYERVLTDGIAFTDVVTKSTSKIFTDGIKISEALIKWISGRYEMVFTDGIKIGEVLRKDISKVLVDGIAFTDIVTRFFERVFTDGIKFRDILYKWRWLTPTRFLPPTRLRQPTRRLPPK